jgi:putative colanic acid biosynthesis acetyltransferase WcaF
MSKVDFTVFSKREGLEYGYNKERPFINRMLWHYISAIVFESAFFPFYGIKVKILRWFGAKVGENVELKPGVRIKYPWKLELGDYVWIGQDVWLDCLEKITIGSNVLISQGTYVCAGAHDWNDPGLGGIVKPIVIEDGVWLCAHTRIVLGITIAEDCVIRMGAVVEQSTEPNGIYQGVPAQRVGERKIRDYPGPKREEPMPAPVPS